MAIAHCGRRTLFLDHERELVNRKPGKIVQLPPNEQRRKFVLGETEAAPGILRSIIPVALDTGLRLSELFQFDLG